MLKGLNRAPQVVTKVNGVYDPSMVQAEDISALVIPDGCVGLPTLAAVEQGIPVIAVRNNTNLMRNDLRDLPFRDGQLIYAENYYEAAGILAALRNGVSPSTLARPMAPIRIERVAGAKATKVDRRQRQRSTATAMATVNANGNGNGKTKTNGRTNGQRSHRRRQGLVAGRRRLKSNRSGWGWLPTPPQPLFLFSVILAPGRNRGLEYARRHSLTPGLTNRGLSLRTMHAASIRSRAPILETLTAYLARGVYPFHTPGHKGGRFTPPELVELWGPAAFAYDLPAMTATDNTLHPTHCVKEAQELAAELFGAAATFYLGMGASTGIAAMVLAAVPPGETILLPRNVHRSVASALVLSGARPQVPAPRRAAASAAPWA